MHSGQISQQLQIPLGVDFATFNKPQKLVNIAKTRQQELIENYEELSEDRIARKRFLSGIIKTIMYRDEYCTTHLTATTTKRPLLTWYAQVDNIKS